MKDKIGLPGLDGDAASPLAMELAQLLEAAGADFTSFFRALGRAARGDAEPVRGFFPNPAPFDAWLRRWRAARPDAAVMDRANPVYIPRNHLVEEALDAAVAEDLDPLRRLLEAVTDPYDERPGLERHAAPAPEDFGTYRTFCGT
jgi:serine/tyrosine/threonine adenylyltransferase